MEYSHGIFEGSPQPLSSPHLLAHLQAQRAHGAHHHGLARPRRPAPDPAHPATTRAPLPRSPRSLPRERSILLRLARALLAGVWHATVTALALLGLAALVGVGVFLTVDDLPLPALQSQARQQLVHTADTLGIPNPVPVPETRYVVYLNREGGTIRPGLDDSRRNTSSVVAGAGLERVEIPEFESSRARWDAIMSCVAGEFEGYDIEITDQRPVEGDYIMAMVGGRPGELASRTGHVSTRRTRVTGLAPLGARAIPNAVVFVFAREMGNQARPVCETIAHEVGHALGLDHVMNCHDPMTHLRSCGRRTFQDTATSCGETEARACINGATSQNSHQRLLDILGPAEEDEPSAPERRAGRRPPSPTRRARTTS